MRPYGWYLYLSNHDYLVMCWFPCSQHRLLLHRCFNATPQLSANDSLLHLRWIKVGNGVSLPSLSIRHQHGFMSLCRLGTTCIKFAS